MPFCSIIIPLEQGLRIEHTILYGIISCNSIDILLEQGLRLVVYVYTVNVILFYLHSIRIRINDGHKKRL